MAILHQCTYSAGFPPPKVTTKETEPVSTGALYKDFVYLLCLSPQGMFVSVVEVGTMKFKGSVCPTPEDANQSAAAVANSNWKV